MLRAVGEADQALTGEQQRHGEEVRLGDRNLKRKQSGFRAGGKHRWLLLTAIGDSEAFCQRQQARVMEIGGVGMWYVTCINSSSSSGLRGVIWGSSASEEVEKWPYSYCWVWGGFKPPEVESEAFP